MSEEQNLPAVVAEHMPAYMLEDAELGKETMQDESSTPFIHLVQKGSPEIDEDSHKVGEFAIRPAGVNLGASFKAVVVAYSFEWLEWAEKRKQGEKADPDAPTGILNRYKRNEVEAAGVLKDTQWNGNTPPKLTETRNFALLIFDESGRAFIPTPVIISLAKTSTKTGKRLVEMIKLFKGPICGQVIEFSSKLQQSNGHTYQVVVAERAGILDSPDLYGVAKETAIGFAANAGGHVATPEADAPEADATDDAEKEQPASE